MSETSFQQARTTGGAPVDLSPAPTPASPAQSESGESEKIAEARAELATSVAMFTAAIDGVAALGLNPLEELVAAGFDPGLGALPEVEAETPPNQLPPV
jgi:hypothetical protein